MTAIASAINRSSFNSRHLLVAFILAVLGCSFIIQARPTAQRQQQAANNMEEDFGSMKWFQPTQRSSSIESINGNSCAGGPCYGYWDCSPPENHNQIATCVNQTCSYITTTASHLGQPCSQQYTYDGTGPYLTCSEGLCFNGKCFSIAATGCEVTSTSLCAVNQTIAPGSICELPPPYLIGDVCSGNSDCYTGSCTGGVCAGAGAGESCSGLGNDACNLDTYCDYTTLQCTAFLTSGASCNGSSGECQPGHFCSSNTFKCTPYYSLSNGIACMYDSECASRNCAYPEHTCQSFANTCDTYPTSCDGQCMCPSNGGTNLMCEQTNLHLDITTALSCLHDNGCSTSSMSYFMYGHSKSCAKKCESILAKLFCNAAVGPNSMDGGGGGCQSLIDAGAPLSTLPFQLDCGAYHINFPCDQNAEKCITTEASGALMVLPSLHVMLSTVAIATMYVAQVIAM